MPMELTLPFDRDACRPLLDRLAAMPAGQNPFAQLAEDGFPEVEELMPLWMVLLSHRRALSAANPDDPYYDPATMFENIARGRVVQKNLFEIWLFLRCYPTRILEIGTRTGLSLVDKLAFHPNPSACLTVSVDLYVEQGSPALVERNLQRMGIATDGICYVRGDSREAVPALARAMPELRYDYILVDGSHKAEDARADLRNAIPLLAPGGFIVFDDAGPAEDGGGYNLVTVWDAVMADHAGAFALKHYALPYGFCVGRRRRQEDTP